MCRPNLSDPNLPNVISSKGTISTGRVLLRDFFALLVALFWALRSYTDAWNRTKRCDPTWQGFLSYVVLTVAALTAVEMFCWAVWLFRRVFRRGDKHFQIEEGTTSLVFINSTNLKVGFLNFAAGVLLLLLSVSLGGPTPCEEPHRNIWSWSFVFGCLVYGLGFLMIAIGLIREESSTSDLTVRK